MRHRPDPLLPSARSIRCFLVLRRPAVRLRSLVGGPDEALAACSEACSNGEPEEFLPGAYVFTMLGGHRCEDDDDGHTLTFRVGVELYSYDWHYLIDEIEDLSNWAREYYASWLWLGFLLEQALGQPRPWDRSITSVVRFLARCWFAEGPAHLSALDGEDVVECWSWDLQLLREEGLLAQERPGP